MALLVINCLRMAVPCLLLTSLLFAMTAAHGQEVAQPAMQGVVGGYSPGSIQSVEQADAVLNEVAQQRKHIEQRFAMEQYECSAKFFAMPCVDAAKERRRQELAELQATEVEANTYKRRARAEARKAESDARRKPFLPDTSNDEGHGAESRAASPPVSAERPAQPTARDPRVERHQEKLRSLDQQDEAEAGKRAARVAAYEEKVRRAEARQQEIERRKKEKEEKRKEAAGS